MQYIIELDVKWMYGHNKNSLMFNVPQRQRMT